MEDALSILDSPFSANATEEEVITALKTFLSSDYNVDDVNAAGLVYYPSAFKLYLEYVQLDEYEIYTSVNRILEYDLESYNLLHDYLKRINWRSTRDYLQLRPYLLVNVDVNKLFELYKQFDLVDPALMNRFFGMSIVIEPGLDLEPSYFGYRKAWHSLYYADKIDGVIEYILDGLDCSASGLIDYILWLQKVPFKDFPSDQHKKLYEVMSKYYFDIFEQSPDVTLVLDILGKLNIGKRQRAQEIESHLLITL